jgi:hypothetical protein
MTKEQDKAIERCNKLIETEHSNWIGITNQKAIETVLNMLKEKDAEIEKLRKHNKELLRKLRNRVKEVKKLQKNPNYKAIVTKQGKTLEERAEQIKKYKQLYNKALDDAVTTSHDNMKKDKMIDLMAEYISDLDIDEDICKKQSDNNCDDINREVECKECIKQYFERIAEQSSSINKTQEKN